jgi:CRP/FNR family transcriptional regulator, cyclic AMP receptor protein
VLNVVYIEVDVLITATRLLKCLEQLGFVPVAYLPAFFYREGQTTDVVKMVKLNLVYSLDETSFTHQAQQMVKIIDHSFQDQKVGLAIISMLRGLPIFAGLGDGELRKVARLFNQKLFRPGEAVFRHGDASTEAYVVMRGQVDIFLENQTQSIASITSGQIFGELAFLDGSARTASAAATQATILLVVSRLAFGEIVQREPHLGMVVMRNIAMDLSSKLRRADNLLAGNT